jgi:hypothetical protein
MDWCRLAQHGISRGLFLTPYIMNFLVLRNVEKFLSSWGTGSFSRRAQLQGVSYLFFHLLFIWFVLLMSFFFLYFFCSHFFVCFLVPFIFLIWYSPSFLFLLSLHIRPDVVTSPPPSCVNTVRAFCIVCTCSKIPSFCPSLLPHLDHYNGYIPWFDFVFLFFTFLLDPCCSVFWHNLYRPFRFPVYLDVRVFVYHRAPHPSLYY